MPELCYGHFTWAANCKALSFAVLCTRCLSEKIQCNCIEGHRSSTGFGIYFKRTHTSRAVPHSFLFICFFTTLLSFFFFLHPLFGLVLFPLLHLLPSWASGLSLHFFATYRLMKAHVFFTLSSGISLRWLVHFFLCIGMTVLGGSVIIYNPDLEILAYRQTLGTHYCSCSTTALH